MSRTVGTHSTNPQAASKLPFAGPLTNLPSALKASSPRVYHSTHLEVPSEVKACHSSYRRRTKYSKKQPFVLKTMPIFHPIKPLLFLNIYFVCTGILPTCMPGILRGQRRGWDPLGLSYRWFQGICGCSNSQKAASAFSH